MLQLRTRVLGETHNATIKSIRDLGETLKQSGDTKRALDQITRAYELQVKGQNAIEAQHDSLNVGLSSGQVLR